MKEQKGIGFGEDTLKTNSRVKLTRTKGLMQVLEAFLDKTDLETGWIKEENLTDQ